MDREQIIKKYGINPEQTLDVFYDDGEVWCSDDQEWSVIRCGEMKAFYQDNQVLYTGDDFIRAGLDTDEKVANADRTDDLVWDLNPWFIVAKKDDPDGEYGITADIVEAIKTALELSKPNQEPDVVY